MCETVHCVQRAYFRLSLAPARIVLDVCAAGYERGFGGGASHEHITFSSYPRRRPLFGHTQAACHPSGPLGLRSGPSRRRGAIGAPHPPRGGDSRARPGDVLDLVHAERRQPHPSYLRPVRHCRFADKGLVRALGPLVLCSLRISLGGRAAQLQSATWADLADPPGRSVPVGPLCAGLGHRPICGRCWPSFCGARDTSSRRS